MDHSFMFFLETIRERFDKPMIVTSAYRCADYDKKLGGKGTHISGTAVDIAISGPDAYQLLSLAVQTGFTGIGLKQEGPVQQRFIHLDRLKHERRPAVWTYT